MDSPKDDENAGNAGQVTKADLHSTLFRLTTWQEHREADRLIAEILDDSEQPFSHNFLLRAAAEVYADKGQNKKALKTIDAALELRQTALYRVLKAHILNRLGRFGDALDIADELDESHPNNRALAHVICVAAYGTGNIERALEAGRRFFTLCDKPADEAGNRLPRRILFKSGKNLISYSLFDSNPALCGGAIINCILARDYLPGWTVRVYVDTAVSPQIIAQIQRFGGEAVRASQRNRQVPPRLRVLPAADEKDVAYYLCRHPTMRLTAREGEGIREWVESRRPFHVLRDHITQSAPMPEFQWGGHTSADIDFDQMRFDEANGSNWLPGSDLPLFNNRIWPLIKETAFVHDQFYDHEDAHKISGGTGWTEEGHIGRRFTSKKDVREEAEYFGVKLP